MDKRELKRVDIEMAEGALALGAPGAPGLGECRPYAAWRRQGETEFRETWAERFESVDAGEDAVGFRARLGDLEAELRFERHESIPEVWCLNGALANAGAETVEVSRFNYLHGRVSRELGFLALQDIEFLGAKLRFVPWGEAQLTSLERQEGVGGQGTRVTLVQDPIHAQKDWALSLDTAAMVGSWERPGWGFGFTGPGTAYGEIGYRTTDDPATFFVGARLEGIEIGPGEIRELEEALVWYGDWQDGLSVWAREAAEAMGAGEVTPPMVGYCSWYQRHRGVKPDEIFQAIEEYAGMPAPGRGRTVQLDDGFQAALGDWGPNGDFAPRWRELIDRAEETGSIPGLWLAPLFVSSELDVVETNPDWIQRREDGEPAFIGASWGAPHYCLEVDHPGAAGFVRDFFRARLDEGWRYFKIDFTRHVMNGRAKHDPRRTAFQTLRALYRLIRETVGPDTLLTICNGALNRYAIGLVDYARMTGDCPPEWSFVTRNLVQLLTRVAANGVWWTGDPDVFHMRFERSTLNFEESHLLLGTYHLFGGLLHTSDWTHQWSPVVKEVVARYWNDDWPRTPESARVAWGADGMPRAMASRFADGTARVGLYNFDDEARDVDVAMEDLRLAPGEWTLGETEPLPAWQRRAGDLPPLVAIEDGRFVYRAQPGHSLRIATLTKKGA